MPQPPYRRFSTTLRPLLLAGLVSLFAGPVNAHPHVWIDTVVKPQFRDGLLTAFTIDWTFDELYSFLVIEDFDSNKDGALDEEELAALAKASRETLASTNYFIRVMADGKQIEGIDFENLSADTFLERISYHFTAVLDKPLNIREQAVSFATYDETYYIEISLDQADPVRFEGDWPRACRYEIGRDEVNRIYFDLVAPTIIRFPCPTS